MAVGLVTCAVNTCPKEDSFRPWLRNFIDTMVSINSPNSLNTSNKSSANTSSDETTSGLNKETTWDLTGKASKMIERAIGGAVKHYGTGIIARGIASNITLLDTGIKFAHTSFREVKLQAGKSFASFGACKIVFCSGLNGEGKQTVFIGAFNTWFPYTERESKT